MSYERSHRRSLDFSRLRDQTRGFPKNYLSYATAGHSSVTPSFARIEDGDVLIECTLVPSGDEVVARLDFDTVDGGASYFPVSYGQRLIIGFPNGEVGDPVVLGRCSDKSWPFPTQVAGVTIHLDLPAPALNPAPMFAFIKTQDGQLLAIESGDGADVLIHAGASLQARVNPGEQVLLTGRTHIGNGAGFTAMPTAPVVAPGGHVTPGAQGVAYVPLPNTNTAVTGTLVPPATVAVSPLTVDTDPTVIVPEDGAVRAKDTVQANPVTAPDFFAWLAAVHAVALTVNPAMPVLPAAIDGKAVTASLNTITDD